MAQMTALRKQGHSVLLACREKVKLLRKPEKEGMMSFLFLSEQPSPAFHPQAATDYRGI